MQIKSLVVGIAIGIAAVIAFINLNKIRNLETITNGISDPTIDLQPVALYVRKYANKMMVHFAITNIGDKAISKSSIGCQFYRGLDSIHSNDWISVGSPSIVNDSPLLKPEEIHPDAFETIRLDTLSDANYLILEVYTNPANLDRNLNNNRRIIPLK